MKNLFEYLYENSVIDDMQMVFEGGASGHLAHIIDYEDLTLDELKGLIYSLFNARITDATEKLDGTNIQASMNTKGEVIFIRNKTDLNSERGGMSVEDMFAKWQDNVRIQDVFVSAGNILSELFEKVGKDFFNPDENTRIFANCECMRDGVTNIIPYASAGVNIHDLWIYKKNPETNTWEHEDTTKDGLDKLEKAAVEIDSKAQLTPNVLIRSTEEGHKQMNEYFKEINKLFKNAHLNNKSTIRQYKEYMYEVWVREHADWIREDMVGFYDLFERWVEGEKKKNIRTLKEMYPEHEAELDDIDKNQVKDLNRFIMKDLDDLFTRIANSVIKLCDGFINAGFEKESIEELKKTLEDTKKEVMANGSDKAKTELLYQLGRLGNYDINPTEGIVFRYKGKLCKMTGSFAAANRIIGLRKF